MKKQSKIIALAISFLLLVVACIGFTASATEAESDKSLAIISQNVSYSEKMYLYFAVYYENVDTDGLVLNVYSSDPDKNADAVLLTTVSQHEEVAIPDVANGTSYICRAFETPGVALKNLATEYFVQAVAVDGTKSAVRRYSVVEYLNEMIFLSKNADEIAAYEKLLAAGDAAQYLLNYYPNDNENDVATNYAYVKVTDGIVTGEYKKGTYLVGEEISLSYMGAATDIKSWKLLNANGELVAQIAVDKSFTVSESVLCVPSNEEPPVRGTGIMANNANTLTFSGVTATQLNEAGKISVHGSLAIGAESMSVSVVDVNGDSALKISNDVKASQGYFNIKTDKVGKTYVFETDIMIGEGSVSSRSTRELLQIFGSNLDAGNENLSGTGIPGTRLKAIPEDGVIKYAITNGTTILKYVEAGEWFNIRYEFEDWSVVGSAIRVYVNGELVIDTVTSKTVSAFKYIRFWMPPDSESEIYLDNTYFSAQ